MPPGVTAPFGYLIDMATVTRTFLVDDLDGSTQDVQNVQISLDGTDFEIDLSAANAARLRGKLAKYVEHGTRVTPQKTRRSHRVVKSPVSGRDQSRRCGTGPGRTRPRCRLVGASPRTSRTPSPPPTEPVWCAKSIYLT